MPEIAEVELQRRQIEEFAAGQTLQEISLDKKFDAYPAANLNGQTLKGVLRHGKFLGLEFERDLLVVHLRMTGSFSLRKTKHQRAQFLFKEPLYFSDSRRFATMEFSQSWPPLLGPDLWSLAPGWTPERRFSKRAIKATLLDQRVLAGIGNYLADESLFAARVSPFLPTSEVSDLEWEKIIDKATSLSKEVLRLGGVSLRDYSNIFNEDGLGGDLLQVYGRAGSPCPRCGFCLQKDKLSGRGTTWCPSCQA